MMVDKNKSVIEVGERVHLSDLLYARLKLLELVYRHDKKVDDIIVIVRALEHYIISA